MTNREGPWEDIRQDVSDTFKRILTHLKGDELLSGILVGLSYGVNNWAVLDKALEKLTDFEIWRRAHYRALSPDQEGEAFEQAMASPELQPVLELCELVSQFPFSGPPDYWQFMRGLRQMSYPLPKGYLPGKLQFTLMTGAWEEFNRLLSPPEARQAWLVFCDQPEAFLPVFKQWLDWKAVVYKDDTNPDAQLFDNAQEETWHAVRQSSSFRRSKEAGDTWRWMSCVELQGRLASSHPYIVGPGMSYGASLPLCLQACFGTDSRIRIRPDEEDADYLAVGELVCPENCLENLSRTGWDFSASPLDRTTEREVVSDTWPLEKGLEWVHVR
jgi:hypothetical protein